MEIQIGATGKAGRAVTEKDTARIVKSGSLNVLATPVLSALMEEAAVNALADFLPEGKTSVGGYIAVHHNAPTLPGRRIEATAIITEATGKKITFRITAREDEKEIGTADHIRFIVDETDFMDKLK